MNFVLDQSKPYFAFFEKICNIPHGSSNEKEISNYIADFAKQRGYFVYQDEIFNLIIKKPASEGYENCPPILLQAHIDMVCEKNEGTVHDFEKDAIKLSIDENGWLIANGTTLGADDGYGVAYMLCILDDKTMKHPALEFVFTVQEETGMQGAQDLKYDLITARKMISLDAAGENSTLTTSAGGLRIKATSVLNYEPLPKDNVVMIINVLGLEGGHSGVFINKERGNSIKLIARFLNALKDAGINYNLCDIYGGSKDNAIPREATAIIALSKDSEQKAKEIVLNLSELIKKELEHTDKNFELKIKSTQSETVITKEDTNRIVTLLHLIPNAVDANSPLLEKLVLTSDNVGVLSIKDKMFKLLISLRSASDSKMDDLASRILCLCELCKMDTLVNSRYPGVEYVPESKFRDDYAAYMKKTWDKELRLHAVHAGTEGGYFANNLKGVEMVCLGPFIEGVHAPGEKMDLQSFERCAKLLFGFLESLKEG